MLDNIRLGLIAILVFGGIFIGAAFLKKDCEEELPPRPIDFGGNSSLPPAPKLKEATFEDALASITEEELKKDLYYLASPELEGRMSGKSGNCKAAEFIKAKYESFGLKTRYQKFKIKKLNAGPKNETGDDFTQNIVAWLDGNEPLLKQQVVVIGAHFDHIGYGPSMSRWGGGKIHPGADDNASGSVALIQIAEAFSKIKSQNKRTIAFISFSAEEMGLIGSAYYCNHPLLPEKSPDINQHIFMLNMDMIGYLGQFQNVSFSNGDSSPYIEDILYGLSKKYSFAKAITKRGTGGSDHANFYNRHIPIAFLHTGTHPHYHKPSDTPDKIYYGGVEKIAKYAFELAYKITNTENKPKFYLANFKKMDTTHDHGHKNTFFKNSN